MKSPILGGSYVARSVNAADNQMINLYPEIVPEGGKESGFLNRCPGLFKLGAAGVGPIRGMYAVKELGYIVSGEELYSITLTGAATLIGVIEGTKPVVMADNGNQIFIASEPKGYIYNVNTLVLAEITDPDFVGCGVVAYLDGFFVYNEPNSQKIWTTTLLDGTSVDPLDFASAEGSPDNIASLIVNNRELWTLGTNSIEVWYNAGTAGFPLARIQGAFNELGCVAAYSVAKLDNSIIWLGSDARGQGMVYMSRGYTGIRISNHAIETAIQKYRDITDAIAYTYQQEGHSFYVLTFPSDGITWCYDVATTEWHRRASWDNGLFVRHRSNCYMSFSGLRMVGDYFNGNIYTFDLNKFSDNDRPQRWVRTWRALPTGTNTLKRTAHHSLEIDCEVGNGIYHGASVLPPPPPGPTFLESSPAPGLNMGPSPQASLVEDINAPIIALRWSDDGGHTWSNTHNISMGSIGEYSRRIIWRRLGMTQKLRDRVYEISGSDPTKICIMGAHIHISPTAA